MRIEASGLEFKTGTRTETCYFTGGLLAHPLTDGHLLLAPVGRTDAGLTGHRMMWPQVLDITSRCGCEMLGVNQAHDTGSPERSEVWRPDVPPSPQQLHAADSWGVLANVSRSMGDLVFSDIARSVSVCIHAAGVRVRDLANAHHEQLRWALMAGKKPGAAFSNLAVTDLHLAFHSLAGELCSARDHLAHIAAIGCGAKESIDSLAWLERWVAKPVNAASAQHPLVALLMTQMGTVASPGWLRVLGEFRNTVMHRRPMGADPARGALAISVSPTPIGPVSTVRLVPLDGTPPGPDPFTELALLYKQFEALALYATTLAPFPVELPVVEVK
ncbi:hypothetical protein FIV34_12150 [Luteibacter pinisoli]|uniref:Uncharacterized protein n=1 Tax=Luteibacter pinisoli TaxID=2589080 RepID=A0A4Y5Z3E2_9GAMM|nr:hypothetical protein [Luteibacter pinisoli]QDE39910.1 hypothetical protein FIV34_12150 [Luteibacter pinisoli]